MYANSFQLFTFVLNRDWIDAVPRIHSLYQFDILSEFRNWSWINLHNSVRHVSWNSIGKSGHKFNLSREKTLWKCYNFCTAKFMIRKYYAYNVCWPFRCLLKIIRILFISRTGIVSNRLQKDLVALVTHTCMCESALSFPKLGTDAGYKVKEQARVKMRMGRQSKCAMAYGVRFPHDLNRWGYANGRELGS